MMPDGYTPKQIALSCQVVAYKNYLRDECGCSESEIQRLTKDIVAIELVIKE